MLWAGLISWLSLPQHAGATITIVNQSSITTTSAVPDGTVLWTGRAEGLAPSTRPDFRLTVWPFGAVTIAGAYPSFGAGLALNMGNIGTGLTRLSQGLPYVQNKEELGRIITEYKLWVAMVNNWTNGVQFGSEDVYKIGFAPQGGGSKHEWGITASFGEQINSIQAYIDYLYGILPGDPLTSIQGFSTLEQRQRMVLQFMNTADFVLPPQLLSEIVEYTGNESDGPRVYRTTGQTGLVYHKDAVTGTEKYIEMAGIDIARGGLISGYDPRIDKIVYWWPGAPAPPTMQQLFAPYRENFGKTSLPPMSPAPPIIPVPPSVRPR
jgi:hypothetical protein